VCIPHFFKMEEILVDEWFQKQLRMAGAELLGDDVVGDLPLEQLYEMMDPEFIRRSNLIVKAHDGFDIPYETLEGQSDEDLEELLGMGPVVQQAIQKRDIKSLSPMWNRIPLDMQIMMYSSIFKLADVERLCMAIGLKYCVNNRIFTRIFATKHPEGYKEYIQRNPTHKRPSWMLRAYEVGQFVEKYPHYEVEFKLNGNDADTAIFRDVYIILGTGVLSNTSSTVISELYQIPKLGEFLRREAKISDVLFINLEQYPQLKVPVTEAFTYVLLKNGFTITDISGESVTRESWGPRITPAPVPDVMKRICAHTIEGKCSKCTQQLCGACFTKHLPCK